MTISINLKRLDNGNGQLEVIQLNQGAETNLGTVNDSTQLTLHSGQSFLLREKAAPAVTLDGGGAQAPDASQTQPQAGAGTGTETSDGTVRRGSPAGSLR